MCQCIFKFCKLKFYVVYLIFENTVCKAPPHSAGGVTTCPLEAWALSHWVACTVFAHEGMNDCMNEEFP
jgi:hypothetical protein